MRSHLLLLVMSRLLGYLHPSHADVLLSHFYYINHDCKDTGVSKSEKFTLATNLFSDVCCMLFCLFVITFTLNLALLVWPQKNLFSYHEMKGIENRRHKMTDNQL